MAQHRTASRIAGAADALIILRLLQIISNTTLSIEVVGACVMNTQQDVH